MFNTVLKHTRALCLIAASVALLACSNNNNDGSVVIPMIANSFLDWASTGGDRES